LTAWTLYGWPYSGPSAQRLLKDAHDICLDEAMPEDVVARVVPGLCRLAIEAAFTEAIRRTQLAAGNRHADVEARIEAVDKLSKKAALAMFSDAARGRDVLSRLNGWHRTAADTYKALDKGAHEEYRGSLRSLVADARALTDLIRSKLA
jgi:hypothetical protein